MPTTESLQNTLSQGLQILNNLENSLMGL